MTLEQGFVYAIILFTLAMLALEIWRYDLVALMGMLLLILFGTLSLEEAFSGFGHPAVVTIASLLVVSRGLQNTGVADWVARGMSVVGDSLALQLTALCGLVVVSSAFMNNIAALAIFIPVAMRLAIKNDRPASLYLLPMAFSSHFGGLITLIGTPPNLIVSEIRMQQVGSRFGMFAFAPVGLAISVIGVAFIAVAGKYLIPRRRGNGAALANFAVADYLSEVEVLPDSKLVRKRLKDLQSVTDAKAWIVSILREDEHLTSPSGNDRILPGDKLLVRAETEALRQFVYDAQVELTESKPIDNGHQHDVPVDQIFHPTLWESLKAKLQSEDIEIVEVIVSPSSIMNHRTAQGLDLRVRYGANLLAISRHKERLHTPVGTTRLKVGDVLLLQTHHNKVPEMLQKLGCLPLERPEIHLGQPQHVVLGLGIFVAAILAASIEILPVPLATSLAAVTMILTGVTSLREAYQSIDWPIIVLLGAMFSMGAAMEVTGGDQLIAQQILRAADYVSPVVLLILMMLVTMILSDVVNNTAAVVLMASIAISVAQGLNVAIEPFLVAIAVGGACAFLTPIGHESNVMVFEIGGYQFGDYWKLGLPLEILITVVTVPLLLWLWPL